MATNPIKIDGPSIIEEGQPFMLECFYDLPNKTIVGIEWLHNGENFMW